MWHQDMKRNRLILNVARASGRNHANSVRPTIKQTTFNRFRQAFVCKRTTSCEEIAAKMETPHQPHTASPSTYLTCLQGFGKHVFFSSSLLFLKNLFSASTFVYSLQMTPYAVMFQCHRGLNKFK